MDEQEKALQELLVDIDCLDQLAEFTKPNVFDILKLTRQEIRHSNFLAYLLNPNDSGEVGNYFVRRFMQKFWKDNNQYVENFRISFTDIHSYNFYNISVQREVKTGKKNKRIDLLLELREVGGDKNLVVVIVNKIDAGEGIKQLSGYSEHINSEQKYIGWNKLFIFLSANGQSASDGNDDWVSMGYETIKEIIEAVSKKDNLKIPNVVQILMSNYREILEREFMENDKLKRACLDIYFQHREALDLIFKHIPDFRMTAAAVIKEVLREKAKAGAIIFDDKSATNNTWICFSFQDIFDASKDYGRGDWVKGDLQNSGVLFGVTIDTNNTVFCTAEIGPFKNEFDDKRDELIKALGIKRSTKKRYTRIDKAEYVVNKGQESEELSDLMFKGQEEEFKLQIRKLVEKHFELGGYFDKLRKKILDALNSLI